MAYFCLDADVPSVMHAACVGEIKLSYHAQFLSYELRRKLECKSNWGKFNTMPILMHQMRISINEVPSVMLRSKRWKSENKSFKVTILLWKAFDKEMIMIYKPVVAIKKNH
jgi:hypothetical protein